MPHVAASLRRGCLRFYWTLGPRPEGRLRGTTSSCRSCLGQAITFRAIGACRRCRSLLSCGPTSMSRTYILFVCLMTLVTQHTGGSPYRDNFFGWKASGGDWGFWRVVDAPLDPADGRYLFAEEGGQVPMATYWCLGFGSYGSVHLPELWAILILILTVAFICLVVLQKRRNTMGGSKL